MPSYKNSTIDVLSWCGYIPCPLRWVSDVPLHRKLFSCPFSRGKYFLWQPLHVLSFWRKNSSDADILSKFWSFQSKFVIFYTVMVEASANMYRVNKLLEIEAADWQWQLERAVGGSFSLLLARSSFPFLSILIPHGNQCPCAVGFQGQVFVHVWGKLCASPVQKENWQNSVLGGPRVGLTEI